MPKVRVKSLRQQTTVQVRTIWKEEFYEEQCKVLKNNFTNGLMRLNSVSGKIAEFSAPADMKLCDMLRDGIDKETFFKIIAQVINVLRWLNSQKLSISNLELKSDYVFVNSKTKELFMLYVPVDGDISNGSLKCFLEMLVFESSFNLGEDTEFKQELMNLLNSGASLNAKSLEQYVKTYCPKVGESIAKYGRGENSKISDTKSEWLRQMSAADQEKEIHQTQTAQPANRVKGTDIFYNDRVSLNTNCGTSMFEQNGGGTVVLNEDAGGTVVLNEDVGGTVVLDESESFNVATYPKLIRRNTGEEIVIDKPVFRIGKEAGAVDYLVPDNPTVSRNHADIISRDGRYYLYDNNSTNRSYVNNIIVEPLKNVELYDGASIRLSDEEFEFRIINY